MNIDTIKMIQDGLKGPPEQDNQAQRIVRQELQELIIRYDLEAVLAISAILTDTAPQAKKEIER